MRKSPTCSVLDVVDKVLEEYGSCVIIYFSFLYFESKAFSGFHLCTCPVFSTCNYSSKRKTCLSQQAFGVNENVGKQVSDMQALPEMSCGCIFGYCTVLVVTTQMPLYSVVLVPIRLAFRQYLLSLLGGFHLPAIYN